MQSSYRSTTPVAGGRSSTPGRRENGRSLRSVLILDINEQLLFIPTGIIFFSTFSTPRSDERIHTANPRSFYSNRTR